MSKKLFLLTLFAMVAMAVSVDADTLIGLSDVTVEDGAIVSLRYDGAEYVVADGDLMLGSTTRWYIPADTGVATLWPEGDPAPEATVSGTSNAKEGDVGSKADNFLFTLDGATNISSIDGIDFQETLFAVPTSTIFVFERGGNDAGTYQAILADGSLGAEVAFDKAANGGPYADTGVSVNGQNAYGVVFITDEPVMGVRITASGHDALSISAPIIPVDPGTEGLMAYYAMEDNTEDSSGNELHGAVVGNAVFVEGPADYGMAIELDGESYVDCGNNAKLDVLGPISIALWIRPDANDPEGQGTETAPLCKAMSGMSPSWSWQVRYGWGSPQPYMAFTFNTSPRAWAYVGQNLAQGEWAHIACSHDGETLKCYLNGVETDSTPMGAITSSETPVLIGSDGWRSDWIGAIDEVAIYDRDLSNGEVRYLAGKGADGSDPTLSIYYTFDEVGDVVADQSGKGHDGVVVGEVSAEAEGIVAGAAKFANAGYIDLDGLNFPLEDIPTSGITLAAWIKCENNGDHHAIFNARASDQTWVVHPEARSNGEFRWLLRSYGGTTMFDVRAGVVTWDEWEHFAGTYDKESAKATLCINGELVSEMDVTTPADIAGDWGLGARVGKNIDDARPFTGLMDEFRLYTRALSQEEIAGL
ncbi:MAG: LamG domain-containing protein [Sedimentisphaerales bacterium]|nr:LamG domain-containing protein [Sedimentisphaerales bacterium]